METATAARHSKTLPGQITGAKGKTLKTPRAFASISRTFHTGWSAGRLCLLTQHGREVHIATGKWLHLEHQGLVNRQVEPCSRCLRLWLDKVPPRRNRSRREDGQPGEGNDRQPRELLPSLSGQQRDEDSWTTLRSPKFHPTPPQGLKPHSVT